MPQGVCEYPYKAPVQYFSDAPEGVIKHHIAKTLQVTTHWMEGSVTQAVTCRDTLHASGKIATKCQDIKAHIISLSLTFFPFAGSSVLVNSSQVNLKNLRDETDP